MENSTAPGSSGQLTGAPSTSSRRQPEGVFARTSMRVPTSFRCTLSSERRTRLQVVGMDKVERRKPDGVVQGPAEETFGRFVPPLDVARSVEDEHAVGDFGKKVVRVHVGILGPRWSLPIVTRAEGATVREIRRNLP